MTGSRKESFDVKFGMLFETVVGLIQSESGRLCRSNSLVLVLNSVSFSFKRGMNHFGKRCVQVPQAGLLFLVTSWWWAAESNDRCGAARLLPGVV